jgi:hypothetical protein
MYRLILSVLVLVLEPGSMAFVALRFLSFLSFCRPMDSTYLTKHTPLSLHMEKATFFLGESTPWPRFSEHGRDSDAASSSQRETIHSTRFIQPLQERPDGAFLACLQSGQVIKAS